MENFMDEQDFTSPATEDMVLITSTEWDAYNMIDNKKEMSDSVLCACTHLSLAEINHIKKNYDKLDKIFNKGESQE